LRISWVLIGVCGVLLIIATVSGGERDAPHRFSAPTGSPAPPPTTTPPPPAPARVLVSEVVDGRTAVGSDGTRFRIAGLAAPGACWAEQATAFARTSLVGKEIGVVPIDGETARVLLTEGIDYAVLAVSRGAGRAESTSDIALTEAQTVATQAKHGLWGAPCDGRDEPPPPPPTTPPPATPPPAPAPPPPPRAAPQPPVRPTPPAAVHFRNCREARAAGVTPLRRGEPGYRRGLDRDGDGIACD
jgi:endonuclease YncB( thermonuclease family)